MMGTIGALLCLTVFYGLTIGILWLSEPNASGRDRGFPRGGDGRSGGRCGIRILMPEVLGLRGKVHAKGSGQRSWRAPAEFVHVDEYKQEYGTKVRVHHRRPPGVASGGSSFLDGTTD